MRIRVLNNLPVSLDGNNVAARALLKLPSGAITPRGWLHEQFKIALSGMPGVLCQYSKFLAPGNGWLVPEKTEFEDEALKPWEEGGCWLRYFTRLAAITKDEKSLAIVKTYMEALLASARSDGWFGSESLLHVKAEIPGYPEITDLWGHMMICEAIWTYYEYTQDARYLDLLHNFFLFTRSIPDEQFIPNPRPAKEKTSPWHWHLLVQYWRAAEILPVLFRVYEATKDAELLAVVDRFYKRWPGAQSEYLTPHTVNFAQEFIYSTMYSRRTGAAYQRNSADYWYNQHMSVWGTLPRGAFCADELIRVGCTDPRYAIESCTMAELPRSFTLLGELNAECIWADRTEDMIFNHYPAAFTYDMKAVHYLTAPNQVMLDDYTTHNVYNQAHTFAYSPLTEALNRCCRHNAALGWPVFTENLIKETDDGICAWMYAPCEAKTNAGGTPGTWICDTDYPFRDTIEFRLSADKQAEYTFYFRIPRWCKTPQIAINGETIDAIEATGKLLAVTRTWCNGDTIKLVFPSEITLSENSRNGGVTVDKGPLSYSLCIPEKIQTVISSEDGHEFHKAMFDESIDVNGKKWVEILPEGPWNYGLMTDREFTVQEHPMPKQAGVFDWNHAPISITAHAKKLPAWKLQDHMVAPLQNSPVRSNEPEELITLIPLGCARLRLSVFPALSDADWANEWQEVPEYTSLEERPQGRETAF